MDSSWASCFELTIGRVRSRLMRMRADRHRVQLTRSSVASVSFRTRFHSGESLVACDAANPLSCTGSCGRRLADSSSPIRQAARCR